MSIAKEFKDFIAQGNVVDLAVGVVIGGAFGKIVDSFVKDLIMPVIGTITGGLDMASMKIVLKAADEMAKKPEVAITYGNFLNAILTFVIVAFAVFMMIKTINKIRKPVVAADAPPPPTEVLLGEIRDLLKK